MRNKEYLEYTYNHRKAVIFVTNKFISKGLITGDTASAMIKRAKKHDLDKAFLYTLIDKPLASRYHKLTSSHHMQANNITDKWMLDYIEAIIDYESSYYTKDDKPLNAYDTIMNAEKYNLGLRNCEEMLRILKSFGMDRSYTVDRNNQEWQDYYYGYMDKCPPTEENILSEIYTYLFQNLTTVHCTNIIQELDLKNKDTITASIVENAVINKIRLMENLHKAN
jgi:hypothetical protein